MTVPARSRRRHDGIKVHCSTTLAPADATAVNDIPVTTVARTLFDLAEVVTGRQLERAFDQADIAETLDLTAINDQLARNPTRRGAKQVRRVLAEHYIGQTPTWNENEELLLAITRGLGLPDPDTNQFIVLPDGRPAIRVDFVWRDRQVVVEADSGRWHSTRQRFEIDRRRDQRLTAAGWTVIRTTWRQMKFRPHELRETLVKLLTPGSPTGARAPDAAGAPAPARPHTPPAGGSTADSPPSGRSHESTTSSAPRPARTARSRERLQVVLDVDREPVGRDTARQVHADRGDLALADPHAGIPMPLVRP